MNHDAKIEKITEIVLETYRNLYNDGLSDGDILEVDPSEYDSDPSGFYESLSFKLGIFDDDVIYPDSGSETVGETIERMAEHWDGESPEKSPFDSYSSWENEDEDRGVYGDDDDEDEPFEEIDEPEEFGMMGDFDDLDDLM